MQEQGTNVAVTLLIISVTVCVVMWVLKWIAVVPLATSAKPFSNIFKLSTTKGFKNALAIHINKLGSVKKPTQALSIHIIAV